MQSADDYIKKPFSITELRARVKAHLRRQQRQPIYALTRSGVYFDMQVKTASVSGNPVGLIKGEYAICKYLALHQSSFMIMFLDSMQKETPLLQQRYCFPAIPLFS